MDQNLTHRIRERAHHGEPSDAGLGQHLRRAGRLQAGAVLARRYLLSRATDQTSQYPGPNAAPVPLGPADRLASLALLVLLVGATVDVE